MSFIDNIKINNLFGRVSRSSNVKSNVPNRSSYISLFKRGYDMSYDEGVSILRDTQVATGFDILKYLLSSKQWILTDTNEDDSTVYDFINEMLKNIDTELGTIVKQMTSALPWGFSVHEMLFDVKEQKFLKFSDIKRNSGKTYSLFLAASMALGVP